MIKLYTNKETTQKWLERYQGSKPVFACILGFTATGLIPGISAAGATPTQRQYTAIADAEFLINGPVVTPKYPLPPLEVGASPVLISRAVVESQAIPVYLFNGGLPTPPSVAAIDLGGIPAQCISSSQALPIEIVKHLWLQGLSWGEKLAHKAIDSYIIIGECVVGGTTTALALLTGLGVAARGKVNSSHRHCNHQQKWSIVETGLEGAGLLPVSPEVDPWLLVSSVGDPMQIVAAGMAIAASRSCGVILAGGTQMLAVYALIKSLITHSREIAKLSQIVVGTTRWVAEDPTGDTVGLAEAISVPLMATQLSFTESRYHSLRVYEQGYVKEGVGAGGCAIAAHLYQSWSQFQLLQAIEDVAQRYHQLRLTSCR